MNYVVAVSGGVDSVVLLDMMVDGLLPAEQLVVAHFDHGIRPESADDARFVQDLAKKYGLPFEAKREELGQDASEELARDRRYAFLRKIAAKYDAKLVTAHHADDVIETIAINLTRGTGWRGLAVLNSPDIERPLLGKTKAELIAYAKERQLHWREDATNADTKYLRNNMRQKMTMLDDQTKQLLLLYRDRQVFLSRMVDAEIDTAIQAPYRRHMLIMVSQSVASEILRRIILREASISMTRPQLSRALLAIKTLGPGKSFVIDVSHRIQLSRTDFVIENR